MSFRARLTLFLLLIVALPMIVIAVLATRTADDAAVGKAEARLFAGLETATSLYEEEARRARATAEEIARDPNLAAALRSGDPAAAQATASRLAAAAGAERLILRAVGGAELASVGSGEAFAPAVIELTDPETGSPAGTLTVSAATEAAYVRRVEALTGRTAAVYFEGQPSVTIDGRRVEVPARGGGELTVAGREQRVLTAALPDDEGRRIALLGSPEEGGFFSSSPSVVALVAGIFVIALLFVLAIRRSLAGQVAAMLEAARRIGSGDFSRKVPVSGGSRDELAGLAEEFNKMSDRLADQMEQLRRQQVEIDRSVRRIGEAFASGLDRDGLLEIVAETAVSACRAHYGLITLTGTAGAEISSGTATDAIAYAVLEAEAQASRRDELVHTEVAGAHALSAPLHRIGDRGHGLGVMTIGREGMPFTEAERDVFAYLIGQASASIENVALHEQVSEQAVTDELTGLANDRSFRDVADKEAARAARFSHPLSLIMLDIDDFKKVNDTYGHPQGDEVLRRVGAILRAESREIDEPARYGGEEFAVALPETGTDGAVEVAERVRARIEAEKVRSVAGSKPLRITASLGVATMPDASDDVEELIAAADAALYAAKRGGKNRVEVAPGRTRRPTDSQAAGDAAPATRRARAGGA